MSRLPEIIEFGLQLPNGLTGVVKLGKYAQCDGKLSGHVVLQLRCITSQGRCGVDRLVLSVELGVLRDRVEIPG
ncbi:hypothetical protein C3Y08_11050 [Burkholderia gladioli]|nr:hypothetical protein C3Y08_11050 [Burkholderia gladioli]